MRMYSQKLLYKLQSFNNQVFLLRLARRTGLDLAILSELLLRAGRDLVLLFELSVTGFDFAIVMELLEVSAWDDLVLRLPLGLSESVKTLIIDDSLSVSLTACIFCFGTCNYYLCN